MTEYREDDLTDEGYCPICRERVTTVFVDGAGWCPDHGRVWCDWTRPARFYVVARQNGYGVRDRQSAALVGDGLTRDGARATAAAYNIEGSDAA